MRIAFALLAVGLTLGAAHATDPARRTATVDVSVAEVISGPGLAYPATGQLRKGDTVIVLQEENGLVAIQPPPGAVSWIRQIHLEKVEPNESGKANVPVAVEQAEVLAGSDKDRRLTNRVTTRLPKGTIVEVQGPAVRVDERTSWYPIAPPEGDVRWVLKSALKQSSLTALAPPTPYHRPETTAQPVAGSAGARAGGTPVAAGLPAALSEHRLWGQASQAERAGDYDAARKLYARIYQDLWDQRAERDAIVICYNRYTRCDELFKKGEGSPGRPPAEGRAGPKPTSDAREAAGSGRWSNPGYLQELRNVLVDGQPVFSLADDRGNVVNYVTGVAGINLKAYNGKRVQVYGTTAHRPELYRPHLLAERVEVAK